MHVYRRIDLKVKNNTPFESLLVAAHRVCSEHRSGKKQILFAFRYYTGQTPAERAKRKYPILAPFEYQYESGGSNHRALSNFGPDWYEGNPKPPPDRIPFDVLLEIASGVPRAYSFSRVEFVFQDVSWLDIRAEKVPIEIHHDRISQYPVDPSICVISSAFSPRRKVEVFAASPVDAPTPLAERLPALSDEILSRLNSIAEVGNINLEVKLSPEEMTDQLVIRPKLDGIREKYLRDPLCGSSELLRHAFDKSGTLPHVIDKRFLGRMPGMMFKELGLPSIKKCLNTAFKPLGYKYSKNYNLSKLSKRGNLLTMHFDYSPHMGSLCASMGIKGPLGFFSIKMYLGPLEAKLVNYPIHDASTLVEVIESCAALAKIWETTLIPEVEKLWPPTPAWYAHEISH